MVQEEKAFHMEARLQIELHGGDVGSTFSLRISGLLMKKRTLQS
jgi:hypothetical protein